MELSEPKAKKRVRVQQQQPLPLIYNDKGELMIFTCHLNPHGTCIVNPEEMEIVNSMGFFGKGSLSRHYPSFGKFYYGAPPLVRNRQWKKRREWFEEVKKFSNEYLLEQEKEKEKSSSVNGNPSTSKSGTEMNGTKEQSNGVQPMEICEIESSDEEECEIINKEKNNSKTDNSDLEIGEINYQVDDRSMNFEGKVIRLPDSDSETEDYLKNIEPSIENEEFPVRETLHLTFEESFFLIYAVGCLQAVNSDGKILSIKEAWDYFCKESKNFIPRYVVYHYFRSKGWVVKPGLKYGGDFLLYKDGPPFYHASFIVICDNNCDKDDQSMHKKKWKNIFGLQRLSETASKEILVAQVIWPDSLTTATVTPNDLKLFTVKEILLRRWVPSKNKSCSDDEYDESL